MASLTALSFAELSSRFPQAGGSAIFVREGLQSTPFSTFVGILVIFAGLLSAAILANAMVGYLSEYVSLSRAMGIILIVGFLGGIAAWGIAQSVTLAALITIIEVGCLLVIIWAAKGSLSATPED